LEVHYLIHNSPTPVLTLAKSIHSSAHHILTGAACFLLGWAKDLSAPLYTLDVGSGQCQKISQHLSLPLYQIADIQENLNYSKLYLSTTFPSDDNSVAKTRPDTWP